MIDGTQAPQNGSLSDAQNEVISNAPYDASISDLDPDAPWNLPYWGTLGGHPIGGTFPGASLERNFSISASVLQNTIGVACGDGRRLPGLVALTQKKTTGPLDYMYVVVVWSEGELPADGIAGLEINGEDASSAPWVASVDHFYGSNSQAASAKLVALLGADGFEEAYTGYAYSLVVIKTWISGSPTSFTATAVLKGRYMTDYRTGLLVSTSNPALVLYDILTEPEVMLGFPTAMVPTPVGGSWRAAADHFDETAVDGEPIYSVHMRIDIRNPGNALKMIGDHAFSEVHFIRGAFQIKTMENPATIRTEVIEAGDWKAPPKWREIPAKTIPNYVHVNYTSSENWKPASVPVQDPTGVAGVEMIRCEATLSGCISRSTATRWATKKYNHHNLERFQWMGYAPEAKIAEVVPGHVITINTPEGVTAQPARVERLKEIGNGWILIELTEYDANTDSLAVATEDTPVSIDGGYSTLPPDLPTSVTRELGEIGNWADRSELDDPDDLTGADWVAGALPLPVAVYDGANEWTEIAPTAGVSGVPENEILQEIVLANPTTARFLLTTISIGVDSGTDADAEITLVYKTGAAFGSLVEKFRRPITSSGPFFRWSGQIPWDTSNPAIHAIGLEISAGTNVWRIKRFHAIDWSPIPRLNIGGLDLFERWGWVEDTDSETQVISYDARKILPSGAPGDLVESVSEGETEIEFSTMPTLARFGSVGGRTFPGSQAPSFAIWMWVNARNNSMPAFSDPTTTFNIDPAPIAPSAVSMSWNRGQDTGLAQEDDATAWATSGTAPTVKSNIDTTPEGNATADQIVFGADPSQIQNRDAVATKVSNSSTFVQLIWLKNNSGTEDITIGSEFLGSGYEKVIRLRDHFRQYRMLTTYSGAPYAGPALKGDTGHDLIACGAKFWTIEDDTTFLDYFKMEWTPASDANTLDAYELQYRVIKTSTVMGWVTHIRLSNLADSVTWGNGPKVDAPHFPNQEETVDFHLYDWRIVAIRGDQVTEFEPTTVTENEYAIGPNLSKAQDFSGDPTENGLTVWNKLSEFWQASSAPLSNIPTPVLRYSSAATLTIDGTHGMIEADPTSNDIDIDLPDAADYIGIKRTFARVVENVNAVEVNAFAGQDIRGEASMKILYRSTMVLEGNSLGTGWNIV